MEYNYLLQNHQIHFHSVLLVGLFIHYSTHLVICHFLILYLYFNLLPNRLPLYQIWNLISPLHPLSQTLFLIAPPFLYTSIQFLSILIPFSPIWFNAQSIIIYVDVPIFSLFPLTSLCLIELVFILFFVVWFVYQLGNLGDSLHHPFLIGSFGVLCSFLFRLLLALVFLCRYSFEG